MGIDVKNVPIVEIAVGLNLIADIVERLRADHAVEITPENIAQYVASRRTRRQALNAALGVTAPDKDTFIR